MSFSDEAINSDMNVSCSLFPEAVSLDTLQSLREDVRVCFNDAFYLKLEDVEKVYSQRRDAQFARFFDVIIRRLKRLTSLHA